MSVVGSLSRMNPRFVRRAIRIENTAFRAMYSWQGHVSRRPECPAGP